MFFFSVSRCGESLYQKSIVVVGGRRVHVCEGEELDPSRVDQISWYQVVRALRRPLGQKTSSQSQYQQGFGTGRKGTRLL